MYHEQQTDQLITSSVAARKTSQDPDFHWFKLAHPNFLDILPQPCSSMELRDRQSVTVSRDLNQNALETLTSFMPRAFDHLTYATFTVKSYLSTSETTTKAESISQTDNCSESVSRRVSLRIQVSRACGESKRRRSAIYQGGCVCPALVYHVHSHLPPDLHLPAFLLHKACTMRVKYE